jgi:hypothetical protein
VTAGKCRFALYFPRLSAEEGRDEISTQIIDEKNEKNAKK